MNKNLFLGVLCLAFAQGAMANYSYNGCGGGGSTPSPTCASYSWDFSSVTPNSNPPGIAVAASGFHQDVATNDTFTARPLTIYAPDHLSLNYDNGATDNRVGGGSGTESSPFHAIDNTSGYDLVVFQFAKPVTLSQISMGYVNTDSDFSLFAFNPVAPGATPIAGAPPASDAFSLGNMLTKGWSLIGSFDYDQLATGGGTNHVGGVLNMETVTGGSILNYASSYWAISAVYSGMLGSSAKYGTDVSTGTDSSGNVGNDRFKIASIAGCYAKPPPPGVPEPASLALVLAGIAGTRLRFERRARS